MPASPSKEMVLAQLSKILRSQSFRNSEMLRNFLSFVVREKLEGNESTIKQYSIAVNAFGRSANFDASTDPIVRIQAGRLRTLLLKYYQSEGKEDEFGFVLHKGSYVPEIEYFIPRTSEESTLGTPNSNTIAIFPIKNLSDELNMQIVVDGFTEELMAELAHYRHLVVVRALEELNAATRGSLARFSLEGSLRLGDSFDKIILSLTDNYTYEVLWTLQRRFNASDIDIIALQEEIALQVAQQIAGLGGVVCEKLYSESNWEKTRNPSAYNTYLHFYKYTHDPSPENTERLMAKVTKAVEAEPDFGPGWAVLARLCCDSYVFCLDDTLLENALEYGARAVELQENSAPCQTYYAYALMVADQFDKARDHSERAIELNPNSVHYSGSVGFLYCLMGDGELGRELITRSISMDFRYPWWFHIGTFIYYLERSDFENALQEAENMTVPHFWNSLSKLVVNYKLGHNDQAMADLQDLMELKADFFDQPDAYINALVKSPKARVIISETLKKVVEISQELDY